MDKLLITGGSILKGQVDIAGAKNSVLPLMAATLLTDEVVELSNIPHLQDVTYAIQLLSGFGVDVCLTERMTVKFQANDLTSVEASYAIVKSMRASILALGPLLAKQGEAKVALPGGCTIGARPVNIHLDGLRAMGADITVEDGFIHAKADRLKGTTFEMHPVTVTGTENLMMAAVLAEGEMVLKNAACEPEVVDLAEFLNAMGAQVSGAGTSEIRIQGVEKLHGVEYAVVADRIEAGTYMVAAAITGGCVRVNHVNVEHLQLITEKLIQAGAEVTVGSDWIEVDMQGRSPVPVNIETAPYPDFPTDMQAQFLALNAVANGDSTVIETVFENRFMHVPELLKMKADIQLDGRCATVKGVQNLVGATVSATDLRASACMVLAALVAKGDTLIEQVHHIDRGYERIEEKLGSLGATIKRLHA